MKTAWRDDWTIERVSRTAVHKSGFAARICRDQTSGTERIVVELPLQNPPHIPIILLLAGQLAVLREEGKFN